MKLLTCMLFIYYFFQAKITMQYFLYTYTHVRVYNSI